MPSKSIRNIHSLLNLYNDRLFVDNQYKTTFGKYVNWSNPKSFTEKIQVFKLSKECERLSKYVDKYEVRKYVEKIIGKQYLIPLLGLYENITEFSKALPNVPNQFVLKATHGSGWNLVIKDKKNQNWTKATELMSTWLTANFCKDHGKERQYLNIKPRIICEKYLEDINGKIDDYKFHCFDGVPRYIRYFTDRYTNLKRSSYNLNWSYLNFQIGVPEQLGPKVPKPKSLELMIDISKKLSNNFNQVRVDLYDINGRPYFGELTFTPNNGANKFNPPEWDIIFGSHWKYQPKMPKKKIGVIYTCVTAHYDELFDHKYINPDWDYVCFTDDLKIRNEKNSHWQLKPLKYSKQDSTRNQRWHKLHPHLLFPEYDYSLWLDTNIDVVTPKLFEDVYSAIRANNLISSAPHPERDCIYDEMQACLDHQKGTLENMQPQIDLFLKDGYPAHNGLFETNILLRKHNDLTVTKIMEDWWWWIEHYSKRDQLSLTYVTWKSNFKISTLGKTSYRSQKSGVHFWPHNHEIRDWGMDLAETNKTLSQSLNNFSNELSIYKNKTSTLEESNFELKDKINSLINQTKNAEKLVYLLEENIFLKSRLNLIIDSNHKLKLDLIIITSSKFYKVWQTYVKLRSIIT